MQRLSFNAEFQYLPIALRCFHNFFPHLHFISIYIRLTGKYINPGNCYRARQYIFIIHCIQIIEINVNVNECIQFHNKYDTLTFSPRWKIQKLFNVFEQNATKTINLNEINNISAFYGIR